MAPTACKRMVSGSISLSYSEYFSPFPHGTCLLSVSSRYLALEEHYLPFSAPIPKCATLRRHPVRMELPTDTGLSPFLVLFSKKTYVGVHTGNASTDYNSQTEICD